MRAATFNTKAAKLRADGVCLPARHAPSWTARLQTLDCRFTSDPAVPIECRFLAWLDDLRDAPYAAATALLLSNAASWFWFLASNILYVLPLKHRD